MTSIVSQILHKNGNFPNNPHLPLLIYRQALNALSCEEVKALFTKNGWTGTWVNGIYSFHHYHSNTHEVLGVCCGNATVQLGGEGGEFFEIEKGDVIILPAGTSHMCVKASSDFTCVGAYPFDIPYDMNYGKSTELPHAEETIDTVPFPDADPVFGPSGPLFQHWN
jgi:uncharacterized protein YjlB